MKTHKIITLICLSLWLYACNDWLDVKPESKIDERKIFSSEEGFKEALLGVYDKMASADLYGKRMTMEFVDILGQRYKTSESAYAYRHAGAYDYASADVTPQIEAIWQKAYNAIADCNNLLEQMTGRENLFTGDNYELIRGELYGIRAYLHFDLLRLFGPVYKENRTQKCLRYYDRFTQAILPDFLTAEAFAVKVLDDLKVAGELLANDRVKTENPRSKGSGDSFLGYRFNRMNFYAVEALKARVLLYTGDFADAKIAAAKVIAASKELRGTEALFPWVTQSEADNKQDPDRIFHKEIIFGLYVSSLPVWQDGLFEGTDRTMVLLPYKNRLEELFPNATDYRSNWFGYAPSQDDKIVCKYAEPVNRNRYVFEKVVPMIRLSEMYLIAAECTADASEAILNYINPIEENRRMLPYSGNEDLGDLLTTEYAREFFGEGQLFYFYKRRNVSSVKDGSSMSSITMTPEKYVIPLPVSEMKYSEGSELK